MEKATFAGGCFWCMVPPFKKLKGVKEIVSGYAGGRTRDPSYREVTSGKTGHKEAVQVTFDPNKTSYKELVNTFWRSIDPTDKSGQFADRGSQYKTAIFYHDTKQKKIANETKRKISKEFDKPIVTKILPFKNFYPAEDYHQNYHRKHPLQYNAYKIMSGRAGFLKKKWK